MAEKQGDGRAGIFLWTVAILANIMPFFFVASAVIVIHERANFLPLTTAVGVGGLAWIAYIHITWKRRERKRLQLAAEQAVRAYEGVDDPQQPS